MVHHTAECDRKQIVMSEKGGTRAGAGMPSTGGGMHEIYLGKSAETKQACDRLKNAQEIINTI